MEAKMFSKQQEYCELHFRHNNVNIVCLHQEIVHSHNRIDERLREHQTVVVH